MVLAVFEAGYAFWQFGSRADVVLFWDRPDDYNGRGSGSYVCPNNLAAMLEMAFGLIVARVAMVHIRKASTERFILTKVAVAYTGVMALVGIVITFSRAGWASTLIGLVLFWFWGDWRPRLTGFRTALVLVIISVLALTAWRFQPVRDYVERSF